MWSKVSANVVPLPVQAALQDAPASWPPFAAAPGSAWHQDGPWAILLGQTPVSGTRMFEFYRWSQPQVQRSPATRQPLVSEGTKSAPRRSGGPQHIAFRMTSAPPQRMIGGADSDIGVTSTGTGIAAGAIGGGLDGAIVGLIVGVFTKNYGKDALIGAIVGATVGAVSGGLAGHAAAASSS